MYVEVLLENKVLNLFGFARFLELRNQLISYKTLDYYIFVRSKILYEVVFHFFILIL